MVERINVSPTEVRGYGNIVISKAPSDFRCNNTVLTQDSNGYYILDYEGYVLKLSSTVQDTIAGYVASLEVLVVSASTNRPVADIVVGCSVDGTSLSDETTDSDGLCSFSWTPADVGDVEIVLSVDEQAGYGAVSQSRTVSVGLLLHINRIMVGMSSDSDDWTGLFEEPSTSRMELNPFVTDVFVANGGEQIVDHNNILHLCEDGDLVVTYENLQQMSEYDNVLFDEDVDLLTGAVSDVTVNSSNQIVVTKLEREDVMGGGLIIQLTSSDEAIYEGESVLLTATLTEEGEPVESETVSFYDGTTLLGTDTTDSNGVATYTASSLTDGAHTLKATFSTASRTVSVLVIDSEADYIELEFTGSSLTQSPQSLSNTLIGTNVAIDYGDGEMIVYKGNYSHTYASSGDYTIKIYNCTGLGNNCFRVVTGLTSIDLPSSVTSLGNVCFYGCTGLTSITISNGVTSLGIGCFQGCTGLTSINIPSSVTSIGDLCFSECSSLAHVYLNWTSSDILTYYAGWIWLSYANLVFNVPNGTKASYVSKGYPSDKVDDGTVTPTVTSVSLTSSSASITTLESATLSATVLDQSSQPMQGETVTFYDGQTSLGTATTNSSGVATKTFTGSAGSHSLTAKAGNITSSSVTVTVSKITPTISLSTSSASVTVGDSFTLSGTLSVGSGVSVKIYQGASLVDTVSTSTGGAYSKTITTTTAGTYSYTAVFEATSTYNSVTSSAVTVAVADTPVPVPASITLTSDKSILSYADSQSATLSATVKDSDSQVMEGVTVEFYKGSTSLGTATTNSSGIATKTYASTGEGDLSFTAGVGSLVSETYSIEDCYFYDSLTSDKSLFTLVQGTATMEYSSDGLKYTGTSNVDCIHKLIYDLPDGSYNLEFDITDINGVSSGYSTAIGTEDAMILRSSNGYYARKISTSGDFFSGKKYSAPLSLKIEVTGTTSKTIKYYVGTTLLGTGSNISRNKEFIFRSYTNRMIQIKDLKIKPL